MIRLDKYLADAGIGTRSEVKNLIRRKEVTVNGEIVTSADYKVSSEDEIRLRQQVIFYQQYVTYLFHKPAGYVTAHTDALHPTVMDFFRNEKNKNLSPVGRLDLDTEGLLLITNDGAFNHRLMSPAHHVPKTYYAKLDKPVPAEAVEAFRRGIDIGDEKLTLPAKLEPIMEEHSCGAYVTLREGRYHQVKRMFAAFGCQVIYLKRISIGSLSLVDLPVGEYRLLNETEIKQLFEE